MKKEKKTANILLGIVVIIGLVAGFLTAIAISNTNLTGLNIIRGKGLNADKTTLQGTLKMYNYDNEPVTSVCTLGGYEIYYLKFNFNKLEINEENLDLPDKLVVEGRINYKLDIPSKTQDSTLNSKTFKINFVKTEKGIYMPTMRNSFTSDYFSNQGSALAFPKNIPGNLWNYYMYITYDIRDRTTTYYSSQVVHNPKQITMTIRNDCN